MAIQRLSFAQYFGCAYADGILKIKRGMLLKYKQH
jgi:hypothetical protein